MQTTKNGFIRIFTFNLSASFAHYKMSEKLSEIRITQRQLQIAALQDLNYSQILISRFGFSRFWRPRIRIYRNKLEIQHNFEILKIADTYNATLPPLSPGISVSAVHIQDPFVQSRGNATFLNAFLSTFPNTPNVAVLLPNYIQFVVSLLSNLSLICKE